MSARLDWLITATVSNGPRIAAGLVAFTLLAAGVSAGLAWGERRATEFANTTHEGDE